MWKRLALICMLLCPALPAHALNDVLLTDADRAEIHSVVAAQITAFTEDNADAAFALASSGLRAHVADSTKFLALVARDYSAVHRPQSVTFLGITGMGGKPVQQVLVVAPSGEPLLALFVMTAEADGQWRVGACYLVRRPMLAA